jgi:TAT (twin-arginine translocation) pathway signal sequence
MAALISRRTVLATSAGAAVGLSLPGGGTHIWQWTAQQHH